MTKQNRGRARPARSPQTAKGGVLPLPAIRERKALEALRRLRQEAQDEIERLIAFLDATDSECDLEDGGDDEPSLGWTFSQAIGDRNDLEDQCEDEGAIDTDRCLADEDEPIFPFPKGKAPKYQQPAGTTRHLEHERGAGDSLMIPMLGDTWLMFRGGEQHLVTRFGIGGEPTCP